MDQIDRQILELLKRDSKQNFKTIGEQIHLTGQAVGNRVRRLEDEGVIEAYTIKTNEGHLSAYIAVSMKTIDHQQLWRFVEAHDEIEEATRISGDCCYILKVHATDHASLNRLCDGILKFANYRLNIITERIK